MPWCEECAKYWTPNSMRDDGTCPKCGTQITLTDDGVGADGEPGEDPDDEKAPWHFQLMIVLLVVYLTWRFVQIFT